MNWSGEIYFLGSYSVFHKHSLLVAQTPGEFWPPGWGLRASFQWLSCCLTGLCFLETRVGGTPWCSPRTRVLSPDVSGILSHRLNRDITTSVWTKAEGFQARVWYFVKRPRAELAPCPPPLGQAVILRWEVTFTTGPGGRRASNDLWIVLKPGICLL